MKEDKQVLKLHHVSFIVKDLDVALAFYQQVLGLECDSKRPDLGYPGAWLMLPGDQQLHLMQLPNPGSNNQRPEHGGRDHHAAFRVKSIDKISALLDERNMTYTKSRSGRQALFCRDPDGNALEFIQSA